MTYAKHLLSAAMIVGALSLSALAPAAAQSRAHMMYFQPPAGPVMTMSDALSPEKEAMLMKHARKLPPGSIVYTTDGAIYVAEDTKMPDGKMLSDALMH